MMFHWFLLLCILPVILGGHDLLNFGNAETKEATTTCNCGWANRGRIVGGKVTKGNEFPLVVSIEYKPMSFHVCGGTIITPWHVLTAAHCTYEVTQEDLAVNVGVHDLVNSLGKPRIDVAQIINHEKYIKEAIVDDIALLVTATEIKFTQNVGPACLPSETLLLEGQRLKALGWGLTKYRGETSNLLQEVDLKVANFTSCLNRWQSSRLKQRPRESTNICTYELHKDTCKGDSGGPLIWLDPAINRYAVVALVSFGGRCGGALPGVNTDVSSFLAWINHNIEASKPGVKACTKTTKIHQTT